MEKKLSDVCEYVKTKYSISLTRKESPSIIMCDVKTNPSELQLSFRPLHSSPVHNVKVYRRGGSSGWRDGG